MTEANAADEARLADLLEQARLGSGTSDNLDVPITLELRGLMETVRQLDAAVVAWKAAGDQLLGSPLPPALPSGQLLGRYCILECIGVGGMGTVYKAHDPQLERMVAVKVPLLERSGDDRRPRFLREARAAAQVRHANLCPIYDVGDEGGIPYAVLEYIDGPTLAEVLKTGRLHLARAIAVARKMALALQAVHDRGILHRDLKPANILLDAHGEPFLTDFGLSRPASDPDHLTKEGYLLGTPAYMAPEQADGQPVDHRCDLFSFGVVLHQMCTGQQPFRGESPLAILKSLATVVPPSVRDLNPDAPLELATLVQQLLAKDPTERPASAREVADRLAVIEKQVAELPTSQASTSVRRRLPAKWGVVATVVLGLSVLAYFFSGTVFRFASNQGLVVIEVDDADTEVTIKENQAVIQDRKGQRTVTLAAGEHDLEVNMRGADGELHFFTKKFTLSRGGRVILNARQEAAREDAARPMSLRRQLGRLSDFIWQVAFSPDWTRCYAASQNGRIAGWETATGKELFTGADGGAARCLAVTPDGRYLVVGAAGSMRCLDALNGKEVRRYNTSHDIWGLAISPDGARVQARGEVWDFKTGKRLGESDFINTFYAYLPGGTELLCGRDRKLQVRSTATDKLLREFSYSGSWMRGISVSPDGSYAASGHGGTGNNPPRKGDDYSVRLWEVRSGRLLGRFGGFKHSVFGTAFTSDSKSFVGASLDGSIRFWDVADGAELGHVEGLPPIYTIALSRDGKHALTGDGKGDVHLWRVHIPAKASHDRLVGGEVFATWPGAGTVWSVLFSPDGKRVYAGAGDGSVACFDADNGRRLFTGKHNRDVVSLALSPDGKFLVSGGGDDKTIRCWDAISGAELHRFESVSDSACWSLAVSPASDLVVGNVRDQSWLWKIETGKVVARYPTPASAHGFLPDGQAFLGANFTGVVVRPFDLKQKPRLMAASVGWPRRMVMSGDGRYAATGHGNAGSNPPIAGDDCSVRLWDVKEGRLLERFAGFGHSIFGLAFTPDSKRLFAVSLDGSMALYDVDFRREIWRKDGLGSMYTMAISPDGQRALTGDASGRIRSWRVIQDANGDVRLWRLRDVGQVGVPSGDHSKTGKLDPENQEQRIKLAHHLAKARQAHSTGLHEVAIAECSEVLRLDHRNFDGLFVRGCAFCDLGKFESMTDDLESAVRLKPDHRDSLRLLGYAYVNTGRPEQCIQVATQLLRSDNMYFGNYVNRAKAYQDLRQLDLALADVDKLVELVPKDASYWFWRAELHKTLGNNREAQENREKAIAVDAKSANRDFNPLPFSGILQRFAGHQGGVAWKVAFSPKGDRIYSAGVDKHIYAWDIATGRKALSFAGHEAEVLAIAVSPDGKWLTSGSKDGTVRIWNAKTAQELHKLQERSGECWGLAFAPDSQRIVGDGGNGDARTLQIWDVSTGKSLVRAQKHGTVAVFHPDGHCFLAGTNAELLRVFDAGSGKAVRDFVGHNHCIRKIAISPDGKLAASASSSAPLGPRQPDEEAFATVWDWSTGKKRFQLNHAERVLGLAFAPDNRRVASGGLDRSVRIWDTESGKEVWKVQALSEIVDLAYSPSGRELAAACMDGMVRLWRLPPISGKTAPQPVRRLDFSGKWSGTWKNTLGEGGEEELQIRLDADGIVTGVWNKITVTGKRKCANEIVFEGKNETRRYAVAGRIVDGELVLKYTATRLVGQGYYSGESRLRRRAGP